MPLCARSEVYIRLVCPGIGLSHGAADDDAAARLKALAEFHGVRKQRLCALLELELPGGEASPAAPRGRMPE